MLKIYKNSFIQEKKFTEGIAQEKFEFLREIKHFIFFLDQFKTRRVLIGFPTKKAKTLRVFDLLC